MTYSQPIEVQQPRQAEAVIASYPKDKQSYTLQDNPFSIFITTLLKDRIENIVIEKVAERCKPGETMYTVDIDRQRAIFTEKNEQAVAVWQCNYADNELFRNGQLMDKSCMLDLSAKLKTIIKDLYSNRAEVKIAREL